MKKKTRNTFLLGISSIIQMQPHFIMYLHKRRQFVHCVRDIFHCILRHPPFAFTLIFLMLTDMLWNDKLFQVTRLILITPLCSCSCLVSECFTVDSRSRDGLCSAERDADTTVNPTKVLSHNGFSFFLAASASKDSCCILCQTRMNHGAWKTTPHPHPTLLS